MNLHIYVDPEYKDSIWCTQTLKGITEQASKKRYAIKYLDAEKIFNTDLDAFFDNENRRILLVLSTSIIKSKKLNEFFSNNGVHLLYINHQSQTNIHRYSNIIIDYQQSMKKIIEYLNGCGKTRIALYGINEDSSTDLIKKNVFEERTYMPDEYGNGTNIYYRKKDKDENTSDKCFCDFLKYARSYDSVICSNDLVARLLIDALKKEGIKVPEDLYVVSFGDYILAQIGKPTITAVSIDHEELGKQSVYTYSYLSKASKHIYITSKYSPKLTIGESTANSPYVRSDKALPVIENSKSDFYNDPEIVSILTFENMLTKCDKLDMQILIGIMQLSTYSQLSERLFVSENVISYRIKRLCKLASINSKNELTEKANRYLSIEAIEKFIDKKLS